MPSTTSLERPRASVPVDAASLLARRLLVEGMLGVPAIACSAPLVALRWYVRLRRRVRRRLRRA